VNEHHLDTFLTEAKEEITELNNSLLELEADPDSDADMDDIFRRAHTLKGNFSAAGFDDASDLAHAVEDLLDEVRDDNIEVTPELIDVAFEGVDQIERMIDEIDETGETTIDPEAKIERIRTFTSDQLMGEDSADVGDEDDQQIDATTLPALEPGDVEDRLLRVSVELEPGGLKGPDAMLVLDAFESAVDLAATVPDRDTIEDGDFEDGFALFADGEDGNAVAESIETHSKVASATVEDVTHALAEHASNDEDSDQDDSKQFSAEEIDSVRVDIDRLDQLYGLVERFVTAHVNLSRGVEEEDIQRIGENAESLKRITDEFQDAVMEMRLLPLNRVIGKFPRMVRDLSRDLGKEVDFTVEGDDVRLDRAILGQIGDPLMHVLRNSVDHGIEPPDEREEKGKPREGTVVLRARRERDRAVIEIEDDGRGLDPEEIRQTAIERAVAPAEEIEAMPEEEVYDLVFQPGFSTTDEVTDVSGRGVGMNVVHETVMALDGSIDVDSELGKGTTVTINLPVTMAIVDVFVLNVAGERYGVPVQTVKDIYSMDVVRYLDGEKVVQAEGDAYPIVDLVEEFDVPGAEEVEEGMILRVEGASRKMAIACDEVVSQREVVVKPLTGLLSDTPGLSGMALLGDGDIIQLVDLETL
jgi:two-component system chemotaxis sensor kinase CheA